MGADVYHKRDIFNTMVEPLEILYDDIHAQKYHPSSPPVQVIIQFEYLIKRFMGKSDEPDVGMMTLLERNILEKKETTCRFHLSELNMLHLSPELSKLGVKPSRHKGIVKKIVNNARLISAVGSTSTSDPRRVLIVSMKVELMRIRSKWRCGTCSKERARNLSIKNVLKGFRVGDDSHGREAVAGEGDSSGSGSGTICCCTICLEEFVSGTKALRLPCLHEFHDKCIVKWLLKTTSCPLCRFEMPILIIKNLSTCPFR